MEDNTNKQKQATRKSKENKMQWVPKGIQVDLMPSMHLHTLSEVSQEKKSKSSRRKNKSKQEKKEKKEKQAKQPPKEPELKSSQDKTQPKWLKLALNPNPKHIPSHLLPAKSNLSELHEDIIKRLAAQEYECIVCYDVIYRKKPIWTCNTCFRIYHMPCISKWSKNGTDALSGGWRCPGCQTWINEEPQYECFCRKVKNPPTNPYLTPHSCGEPCGKSRSNECPHPCPLICHPGSCPPCSALGPIRSCPCSRTQYRLRCGEPDPKQTCQGTCDAPLTCGKSDHTCQDICHYGPCSPCQITTSLICYCSKSERQVPCGEENLVPGPNSIWSGKTSKSQCGFSCGEKCGAVLNCGNHTCQSLCHPYDCQPCSREPNELKTCACGQTEVHLLDQTLVARFNCLDPLPTCTKVCGKILSCGLHACKDYCHDGECATCTEVVQASCRCGSSTKNLTCSELQILKQEIGNQNDTRVSSFGTAKAMFLCDRICNKKLSCQNHKCHNRCCPLVDAPRHAHDPQGIHLCVRTCNKLLACRDHTCDRICHIGSCGECQVIIREDWVCDCGHTTLRAPFQCGTPYPTCSNPCSKNRDCGHKCVYPCHKNECPPCAELTQKICAGGHTLCENVPCYLREPQCDQPCGKLLSCRIHKCQRGCHPGGCTLTKSKASLAKSNLQSIDQSNRSSPLAGLFADVLATSGPLQPKNSARSNTKHSSVSKSQTSTETFTLESEACDEKETKNQQSNGVASCGNACGARKGCGHPCEQLCHPGQACSRFAVCGHFIEARCPCGRLSEKVICGFSDEEEWVKIPEIQCDKFCRIAERNRKLADALQIDPTKHILPGSGALESAYCSGTGLYSRALLHFASQNLPLARKIEKRLTDLAQDESNPGINLPPMPRAHRAFTYELLEAYGLKGVSHEPEPRRYIRVTRTKEARVPAIRFLNAVADYIKLNSNQGVEDTSLGVIDRMHPLEPNASAPKFSSDAFFTNSITTPKDCQHIHFYDLPRNTRTEDITHQIEAYSRPEEYQLRWLDDYNILIRFDSAERAKRLYDFLESIVIPFKFRFWGTTSVSSPKVTKDTSRDAWDEPDEQETTEESTTAWDDTVNEIDPKQGTKFEYFEQSPCTGFVGKSADSHNSQITTPNLDLNVPTCWDELDD